MNTFIKRILMLYLSLAMPSITIGQEISGRLVNTNGEPVCYGTVVFLQTSDSSFVAGIISGDDGRFEASLPAGIYTLRATSIGHEPFEATVQSPSSIGDIELAPTTTVLGDVVIKGDAIQRTPTGIKVDVQSLEYARDRNMEDVLPFLPGVDVVDGNIQIFGEATSIFYIDGVRVNNSDVVKQLSSGRVKTIEIDYHAGVGESATTRGGVIRITTAKQPKGGFEALVRGTSSSQPSNLLNKWEGYGELSMTIGKAYVMNTAYALRGDNESHREDGSTYKSGNGGTYASITRGNTKARNVWDMLGVSYEFDAHHTLKGSVLFFHNQSKRDERSVDTFDGQTAGYSINGKTANQYIQAIATYDWRPDDSKGLTIDANYLYYDSREDQHGDAPAILSTGGKYRLYTSMTSVRATWGQPLTKGSRLYTGADFQLNHSSGSRPTSLSIDIYSPGAFAAVVGNFGKLSYNIGARLQDVEMKVNEGDVRSNHGKLGIYPMMGLQWVANSEKGHSVSMTYKRTMDNLPYTAVSTYRHHTTPYCYTTGNPDIEMASTHMVDITATLWKKWTLHAGYIYDGNSIEFVTENDPDDPALTRTMPINSGHVEMLSASVGVSLQPFKWWFASPSVGVRSQSGKLGGVSYPYPTPRLTLSASNYFRFSDTFSGNMSLYFESGERRLDANLRSVGNVRLGLTKVMCGGRLVANVEGRPVWRNRVVITDNKSLTNIYRNREYGQYMQVSLTWKFRGGQNVERKSTGNSIQSYEKYESSRQ